MSTTIDGYFSDRVEELISKFAGRTLIFFKGFGLEQIRFLITHPNSLLDDASLLHKGFLDLEAIDDRWLDLAASIKSATKPLVGFYEELLAIRQFLPRMKVDKIVVIENNLLSPWVPCYFPYSYAEKLFDYWQTEHEPPAGSPLLQLVQMYGDVKLLKEGKALLLPATLDDERIEIIPFWQGGMVEKEPLTDDIKHIEVGSIEDWEYCLNMTNGVLSSALFLQSGDSLSARTSAIFSAANLLNLEVFLDELELYQEKIEYNDNDPEKLERLATSGKYTNGVLQSIQEHHRNNERLLTAFFAADMNDDERWELIEQYFLGNEEYVRHTLSIVN